MDYTLLTLQILTILCWLLFFVCCGIVRYS